MTLDEITGLARTYAAARGKLTERTEEVREEQRKIARRRLRGIRNAVAETVTAGEALSAAIEANRDLFGRPRTRSVDGVKFGLRKKAGKISVENTETAIARLRRRLGAKAEAYIRTRRSWSRTRCASWTPRHSRTPGSPW